MKLLIVTQVLDTEHPILGFFHRWVEEFSKNFEEVHVICLQEGKHDLPKNVSVYSLGKESRKGRLTYAIRFLALIWKLRKRYDNVFVHMNQIYVILGAPFWRASGKKVGLWYTHGSVPMSLRVAEKFTNIIFSASPESFNLKSKKLNVTGHGIDSHRFAMQSVTKDIDLITMGRITKSKNLFELVDIVYEVRKSHNAKLTIVGAGVTEEEREYEAELKEYVLQKQMTEHVDFLGRVPQARLPAILNRAKIFVTVAQNGSLDKAILEAMSCGLPVVSMAPGTKSLELGDFQVDNKEHFIQQLSNMMNSSVFKSDRNAEFVRKNHSIQSLIPKIKSKYVQEINIHE